MTPLRGFWILVATGSFFWIAHVYADLLADRIKGHHRMGRHAIEAVMAREWPLLQSSFVLAVPLALGAVGAVITRLAFDLAWLSGMAALVGWESSSPARRVTVWSESSPPALSTPRSGCSSSGSR